MATMPFGFARGYVAQVPAPLSGMTASPTGYSESVDLQNGGAAVFDSAGKHMVYTMSFNGDAQKLDGIDVFRQFAAGLYGRDLLHFSDPMNYDVNLLPPAWAAPHLAEVGWKAPIIGTPTYSAATPTSVLPYRRRVAYELAMAPNAVPTHPSKIATILIPPTHKLHLGFLGTVVGTAAVRVAAIKIGGATQDLLTATVMAETSTALTNMTVDGATYQAVEIYVTRTSTAASAIRLVAATAQLHRRSVVTAPAMSRHQPGHGHTGVRFGDAAIPETYKMIRGHRKQLSTTLIEVGAWA